MIPVTLWCALFQRTHYYITALLVMCWVILPFFAAFEGRRLSPS